MDPKQYVQPQYDTPVTLELTRSTVQVSFTRFRLSELQVATAEAALNATLGSSFHSLVGLRCAIRIIACLQTGTIAVADVR